MTYRILAVNPGSTSTKIALFEDERTIISHNIAHPSLELSAFKNVWEQQAYRQNALTVFLNDNDVLLDDCDIIVARGGRRQTYQQPGRWAGRYITGSGHICRKFPPQGHHHLCKGRYSRIGIGGQRHPL